MKNKVFVILTMICLTVMGSVYSARANHIYSAQIEPSCTGFILSIVAASWCDCTVNYDLTLTPLTSTESPKTVSGSFVLPAGHYDGYMDTLPYVFNGIWDAQICGSYSVTGTLSMTCESVAGTPVEIVSTGNIICPCDPVEEVSPRTQGYWKTHQENWSVQSLMIGNVLLSQQQLLNLLNTSSVKTRPMDLTLKKQLIAAMLNVAAGAINCGSITGVINEANAYLAAGVYDKKYAEYLKNILDNYNNSCE